MRAAQRYSHVHHAQFHQKCHPRVVDAGSRIVVALVLPYGIILEKAAAIIDVMVMLYMDKTCCTPQKTIIPSPTLSQTAYPFEDII